MATKKDPAVAVVAFFENAPIDAAQTVLAIAKGIVAKRQPAKSKPRVVRTPTSRVAEG